jgi:hypothetical protein
MASIFYDRMLVTSTTNVVASSTPIVVGSAVSGYQSFASVGDGNLTPMAWWEVDGNGNPNGVWEVCEQCTYTAAGTSISRGTFVSSSTGSAITSSSANKRVAQSLPSSIINGLMIASKTHIAGLELSWVSASAINISVGSAYIPSINRIIEVTSTINLTSLSLGNSVYGYVYLLANGTAECVTTAPAAPYSGFARAKGSDTSRRFLGTLLTNSSGNIIQFTHDSYVGKMRYIDNTNTRLVSNGLNSTPDVTTDLSSFVPPQVRRVHLLMTNLSSNRVLYIGSGDYTVSATLFETYLDSTGTANGVDKDATIGCSSAQLIKYVFSNSTTAGLYMSVLGYILER